jgi:IclR family transcriptional regulator, pca regulon regulatory protein
MLDNLENVKEDYIVSSMVRGLTILSTFTIKRPALKVTEIAEITGFDQATVFRFVYTLEKLGYLVRDEGTKRYHQSIRMLTLSLPAHEGFSVREVAQPVMIDLSETINETVKLAILDGVDIVMVALAEVPDRLVFRTPIGHRSPSYCTAQGKALLAFQPVETWDWLISKIDFIPRTVNTITDPQRFREELQTTRQRGYSIQDGENIIGLSSIAAPIFNHTGEVAGAINISGLSMTILHEDKIETYIQELLKRANIISAKLGYVPETEG